MKLETTLLLDSRYYLPIKHEVTVHETIAVIEPLTRIFGDHLYQIHIIHSFVEKQTVYTFYRSVYDSNKHLFHSNYHRTSY